MSDGLNLFDERASAVGGFPMVFRGYEKDAVDSYIREIETQLSRAKEEVHRLERENAVAQATQGDTDFARLGSHATMILTTAEREAAQITANAAAEADRITSEAHQRAAQVRAHAEQDAGELQMSGHAQLNALRAESERQSGEALSMARSNAESILATAQARAAALQREADQGARTVTEQAELRAREIVHEAELAAAKLRSDLATEQAQSLATMRQRHDEAGVATNALLTSAREQADQSAARIEAETAEAARIRAAAVAEAEQIKVQAAREAADAEQMVRRQAAARNDRLEQEYSHRKEQLLRETAVLDNRKQAIIGQLEALASLAQEGGRNLLSPDEINKAAGEEASGRSESKPAQRPAREQGSRPDPDAEPTQVINDDGR